MWQNVRIFWLKFGTLCLTCTFSRPEQFFLCKNVIFLQTLFYIFTFPTEALDKLYRREKSSPWKWSNTNASDFHLENFVEEKYKSRPKNDLEPKRCTFPAGVERFIDLIITDLSQFDFSATRHPPSRRWYYDCLTLGYLYSKSLLHGLKMKPQNFSTRNTDEFNINTNSPSKPSSVALFHSTS